METFSSFRNIYALSNVLQNSEEDVPFIWNVKSQNQRMPSSLTLTSKYLIVATIYLQLIQNRYMFRSFTVLHCSHQHCVQPVASVVEVVGYL